MSVTVCSECQCVCFDERVCKDGVKRFMCDGCFRYGKQSRGATGNNRADRRNATKDEKKGNSNAE